MSDSPPRSLLYAPADDLESIETAVSTEAEAIILDLESTVPADRKHRARENVLTAMETIDFDMKKTVVRINGAHSDHWLSDLTVAIEAEADALRFPKIESASDIDRLFSAVEQLTDDLPEVLLQLETPRGFLNGPEIADYCADRDQVTGIGVGIGDYTKAIGVDGHTNALRTYLLNRSTTIAAAGNMSGLGYVHKRIDDFHDVATLARSLGHVGQPVSSTVDPDPFISVLHEVYPR